VKQIRQPGLQPATHCRIAIIHAQIELLHHHGSFRKGPFAPRL
jgi:hypothetical protein